MDKHRHEEFLKFLRTAAKADHPGATWLVGRGGQRTTRPEPTVGTTHLSPYPCCADPYQPLAKNPSWRRDHGPGATTWPNLILPSSVSRSFSTPRYAPAT
jgi:hypothetical protein